MPEEDQLKISPERDAPNIPRCDYCTRLKWKDFLHKYYYNELKACPFTDVERTTKSFTVDYAMLTKFDFNMAEELLKKPAAALAWAAEAFKELDPLLINNNSVAAPTYIIRVQNLPMKTRIRDLRSRHMNRLVALDCVVRKISDVYPRCVVGCFECARCGDQIYLSQEGEGRFLTPSYCNCNDEKKGVFRLLFKESTFIDFQRMKVQESPEDLQGGEQPQDIEVNITQEVVGYATPGDHIILNGVIREKQMHNREGMLPTFELYVETVSIEYKEETYEDVTITAEDVEVIKEIARYEPTKLRKYFIDSIAPSIYGYDEVKEAGALSLFSGVAKNLPGGTRIRGDIHVLLVGDPGIGKSQIIRYVVDVAPRGVFASGKSASAAGLTAAATKDDWDGQWTLEAGAAVLANNGMLGVDELDKAKPDDRTALHEVMEQQELNVAKAGILAKLKTRCAIFSGANPKMGRFDPYEDLGEQVNMPPSLLSRFDLIFILQDKPDETKDKNISRHILNSHQAGEKIERHRQLKDGYVKPEELDAAEKLVQPALEPKMLRKYIAYAKSRCIPIMTDEAKNAAEKFYVQLRKPSQGEPIPITARQLEGITRLSEANARMRLSDTVTADDVNQAIRLIKYSLGQTAVDHDTGKLDIDVLTIGTGQAQRERIKDIRHIIIGLEASGGLARYDDIVSLAAEHKITKDKVDKEIKKLKEIGDLFEPQTGRYKTT